MEEPRDDPHPGSEDPARALQFKGHNHRLGNARGWEGEEEEVASETRDSFRG